MESDLVSPVKCHQPQPVPFTEGSSDPKARGYRDLPHSDARAQVAWPRRNVATFPFHLSRPSVPLTVLCVCAWVLVKVSGNGSTLAQTLRTSQVQHRASLLWETEKTQALLSGAHHRVALPRHPVWKCVHLGPTKMQVSSLERWLKG